MAIRRRHGRAALLVAAGLLFGLPGAAGAYSTAPGYSATTVATGFPEDTANHWGPIGIAFDPSDNLYVADTADGNIYRFQPGGGEASPGTQLTSSPIPGHIEGLAVTAAGELYLARYQAGDVVQVDPGTGAVLRTVANVKCATGLAVDPASGDLFVSQNLCGSTIYRVSGYESGPGTVSAYASAHGVDGLAFDQTSGTLYAESDGNVLRIAGTASPIHGAVTAMTHVANADGLAFGAHSSGEAPYLVANRTDGRVTRVDFGQGLPAQTDIFSGGSRGDFAAVDSNGCLYITQSASVVRIGGAGDACRLQPSTPGPPPAPAVIVTQLGGPHPARACERIQSLRLRVRQQGRVRLRSATVYLNGKVAKRLTGDAVTAPFVLAHLPRTSFTVTIVAVTTTGRQVATTQHYRNCDRSSRARCTGTRALRVLVPQRRGDPARLVAAYVNGRRVAMLHGRAVRRLTLHRLPHGRFTVRLYVRYARGRPAGTSRTYMGC